MNVSEQTESTKKHTPNWQLGWQWLIVNVLVWAVTFSTPVIETLNIVGRAYVVFVFVLLHVYLLLFVQERVLARFTPDKRLLWISGLLVASGFVVANEFVIGSMYHIVDDWQFCQGTECLTQSMGLNVGSFFTYLGHFWRIVPYVGTINGAVLGFIFGGVQRLLIGKKFRRSWLWITAYVIGYALGWYILYYFHPTVHYVWARLLISSVAGLTATLPTMLVIVYAQDAQQSPKFEGTSSIWIRLWLPVLIVCGVAITLAGFRPCGCADRLIGISGCYATLPGWGIPVGKVAFSPDSQYVATRTAFPECAVKVWRISDGKLISHWFGGWIEQDLPLCNVSDIRYSKDGTLNFSFFTDADYHPMETNLVFDWLPGIGPQLIGDMGGDHLFTGISPDGKIQMTCSGWPESGVLQLRYVQQDE